MRKGEREHGGGAHPTAVDEFGEIHPLTSGGFESIEFPDAEARYSVGDLSDAFREVFLWVVYEGKENSRFRLEGVSSRAIVAAWLISPDRLKAENQSQLAEKLGLSKSRTARIVRSFCKKFNFVATRNGHRPKKYLRRGKK